MEEKINIADILKDKPEKTILYDAMRDINVSLYVVEIRNGETNIFCDGMEKFKGCSFVYSDTGADSIFRKGMQLLKPSKEMQDWEKFSWKKDDVLVNSSGFKLFFDRWANDDYTRFFGKVNLLENSFSYETEKYTLASKDENLDTLEIEKPEFKDGDIVVYGKSVAICRKICKHTLFPYVSIDETSRLLFNDNPNVSPDECRFAKEEEKQQLFDALEKEGKAWDAEKKQIVDLKLKCEFKPFDRCIWKIRNCEFSIWQASFVSYVDEYGATPMGMSIDEDLVNLIILPYNDQTKLLVGTTDEWKGGKQ